MISPQHPPSDRDEGERRRLDMLHTNHIQVFEVSPDHDIVWRFANPDVKTDNMRVAIWRMTRYPSAELDFIDSVDGLESSQ